MNSNRDIIRVYIIGIMAISLLNSIQMFPEGYENRSIISDNFNEWRDEENCGVFQFPEDFFVSGIEYDIPENKEGKGKEFYGGKNKDKYLVCTWKNGKKNGEGLLYNQFGEVLFRGTYVDDNLEGEGYIYDDGVVIYKFFYKNNKRDQSVCICYSESSILMKEFSPEGNLIYCGGFNSDYQREGYGAEYTQGFLSSYGLYENNVINLRIKTFSNGIMREYNKSNDEEVIYIGEYKDSIEEGFPREGEGREYADSCLLFHGLYENNKRHGKGTLFFSYGIARLKGIWKEGVCIEEHEIDECGFYKEVKYDGRSINSIHINNDRIILNSNVIHFRIHSLMCNGEEIRKLVLKNMERIETISIGNKCFSNVRCFEVYNLSSLYSIEIGQDSFTNCDRLDNKPVDNNAKDICIENNSKCTISNCSCLTDIKIGEGSFSSFCEFNLKSYISVLCFIVNRFTFIRIITNWCFSS